MSPRLYCSHSFAEGPWLAMELITADEAATKRQETIRSQDPATERLEWESERAATYAAVQSLQHVGSHSLL